MSVTVALTHPVFGEVNPQRVMKLIQKFNKLLPLHDTDGKKDNKIAHVAIHKIDLELIPQQ